jgi:putative heme-binding domain-containing protein
LASVGAPLRREAATAVGRLRRKEALPALWKALRAGGDRFLEHSLIYALIEIGDRDGLLQGLRDPSPVVRRAALIALDQMDGGNLTRGLVTPLLNTDDPALQQTALAIITARPGWAKEIAGLLRQWLGKTELDAARQESLRGALLAFSTDPTVQEVVAQTLRREQTPLTLRLLLLETMARVPLKKLPAAWVRELGHHLRDRSGRIVRQTVATIRAAGVSDFDGALLDLAKDKGRPAGLRVAALAAAAPRLKRTEPPVFVFLVKQLDKDGQPLARLAAAEVLGQVRLDEAQLLTLAGVVDGAGPLEMPHLLAAYEQSHSGKVGARLVAGLAQSPGLPGLTADALRRALRSYPAEVRKAARPLFKRLEVDTAKQKARLAELNGVLTGGDARRGQAVFFGVKASCAACHTVHGNGGRVGPELTKIGATRSGPDLLEAIVFPSASFARGYEPFTIETREGKSYSGIIARATSEAIYLRTADRAEIRLARSTIDTINRSQVSIMPQGLDGQLSKQELADLIAFLKSLQ